MIPFAPILHLSLSPCGPRHNTTLPINRSISQPSINHSINQSNIRRPFAHASSHTHCTGTRTPTPKHAPAASLALSTSRAEDVKSSGDRSLLQPTASQPTSQPAPAPLRALYPPSLSPQIQNPRRPAPKQRAPHDCTTAPLHHRITTAPPHRSSLRPHPRSASPPPLPPPPPPTAPARLSPVARPPPPSVRRRTPSRPHALLLPHPLHRWLHALYLIQLPDSELPVPSSSHARSLPSPFVAPSNPSQWRQKYASPPPAACQTPSPRRPVRPRAPATSLPSLPRQLADPPFCSSSGNTSSSSSAAVVSERVV